MRIKDYIGITICILSVVVGLYIGIWLMLIGGIVQIINGFNPVSAYGIAIGIARFLLSGIAGWITFGLLFAIGQTFFDQL